MTAPCCKRSHPVFDAGGGIVCGGCGAPRPSVAAPARERDEARAEAERGATDLAHEDARVAEAQRDTARADRDALASAVRAYLAAQDTERVTHRCSLDYRARVDAVMAAEDALRAALARVDGGGT